MVGCGTLPSKHGTLAGGIEPTPCVPAKTAPPKPMMPRNSCSRRTNGHIGRRAAAVRRDNQILVELRCDCPPGAGHDASSCWREGGGAGHSVYGRVPEAGATVFVATLVRGTDADRQPFINGRISRALALSQWSAGHCPGAGCAGALRWRHALHQSWFRRAAGGDDAALRRSSAVQPAAARGCVSLGDGVVRGGSRTRRFECRGW